MPENPEVKDTGLHRIEGCRGCSRNCRFNGNIATKEVANSFKEKLPCNK